MIGDDGQLPVRHLNGEKGGRIAEVIRPSRQHVRRRVDGQRRQPAMLTRHGPRRQVGHVLAQRHRIAVIVGRRMRDAVLHGEEPRGPPISQDRKASTVFYADCSSAIFPRAGTMRRASGADRRRTSFAARLHRMVQCGGRRHLLHEIGGRASRRFARTRLHGDAVVLRSRKLRNELAGDGAGATGRAVRPRLETRRLGEGRQHVVVTAERTRFGRLRRRR